MTRTIFPIPALLLAFAALLCNASAAAPTKPNIIFVLADDLGATDLSCYGSPFYQTPHIDKLARDGVKFTHAYSACTVCSPTRAALMIGRYPAALTDLVPKYLREIPTARAGWTKVPFEYSSAEEDEGQVYFLNYRSADGVQVFMSPEQGDR